MMHEVKLGPLVEIKTGKLDANAEAADGQYPFFTCSKDNKRINRYSFEGEYVIVAGNGDLNVKYYSGKFDAYQRTYTLKPGPQLDGKFLYHFMSKYVERLREQSIGGVIKYIKLGNLTDALIPLPPLEEQLKIAAILDAADAYRQKTKALIDKYDQLTQSLFLDMFGDPVTNPMGWELKKMGEVSTLKMGGTPSTTFENYYSPKEVRWLKSGDIKKDFITEFPNYISNEGLTNSNTKLYDENTVVIALNGQGKTRGTTGILTKKSCSNQSVANIDPDPSILNFVFLHFQLKYRYSHLRNLTGDNDRSGLNLTVLRNYVIILPHNAIQNQFAERVSQIEKQKQQAEASLVKAEELFNSLLQRAFKGELTN